MIPTSLLRAALVLAALAAGGLAPGAQPAAAQVRSVALVERGRPVPIRVTAELESLGRGLARGLLATAHRDVTRPVTDGQLDALARRGTLLRIRLVRPETVTLLRLGSRSRASRLAAYVPPQRDDRAYIFLGRGRWSRIVLVDLPAPLRSEVRRLRSRRGSDG
jgi:hypothetical protein